MARRKVHFFTTSDLMLQLAVAKAQAQLKERLARTALGLKLRIIDKIGYLFFVSEQYCD